MKSFTYFFLILLCLISLQYNAQEFQGIATYFSATGLNMKMDSTQFSTDQQKSLMESIRKQMQKEYELIFTRNESSYKEQESLEKGGTGFRMMAMVTGSGGPIYKNLSESRSTSEEEFFGKLFLVKDSLETFDWKITNESKKIGAYNCIKATASRIVSNMEISAGSDEKTEEVSDTIEIVAWFTPQIPVSHGPAEYGGLPGLIMELQSGKTTILCTQVVLNPEQKKSIVEPKSGEEVSREEFRQIVSDKLNEMQEMYGGDRGRGRGSMKIQITR